MIKIVADAAIPLLNELFGAVALIKAIPGHDITHTDVKDADVLLVRTITKVNQTLLHQTAVKFVGTMTAGTDHIDHQYLAKNNIFLATAAGANANAVAEYVISCIAYLQQQGVLSRKNIRAGIIGVGHAGQRIIQLLKIIGIEVICSDPLRQEPDFTSTPLHKITDCDIISLHTSLSFSGPFATHHFIDKKFLHQQKPSCVLINTSRGEVLNPDTMDEIGNRILCLDVFENEPRINVDHFSKATIATPHIAGYSQQAKLAASVFVYEAAKKFFHWKETTNPQTLATTTNKVISNDEDWREVVLQAYNPYQESLYYKEKLRQNPLAFEILRREYHLRPEFSHFTVINGENNPLLQQIGFHL